MTVLDPPDVFENATFLSRLLCESRSLEDSLLRRDLICRVSSYKQGTPFLNYVGICIMEKAVITQDKRDH